MPQRVASSKRLELMVVSSNLTSTVKTLFNIVNIEFPHAKNLLNTLPGPPEVGTAGW